MFQWFHSLAEAETKDIDQSTLLGMKMLYGGSVSRTEFEDMVRTHREKR